MRQYEMTELVYEAPAPTGSYVDINLAACFESADERESIRVKGFYAGSGKYKIRFMPSYSGKYFFRTEGMIQDQGELFFDEADPSSHGPVSADGTALKFADGTCFHSFGTTVYALAHQNRELTQQTFNTLKQSGFNKIRICVFPKHYVYNNNEPEYYAFEHAADGKTVTFTDNLGKERTVPFFDPERPVFAFWDDFEEKLKCLFDMGMQVDLILFHPYDRWGFAHMGQENNLIYLDYVVRRLAAFPNIWWSMANEYDLFFDWDLSQWHEIEEYIAANDPWHHMLSCHNCFIPYDFGRKAITHVSLQHRTMILTEELMNKYHKPVLYDECCYEGNLKESWGSISAKEMVNRFWKVTVPGGYCTHGEVLLDPDEKDKDNAVLWWAKGGELKGESPERIAFLRKIIEGLDGHLEPYHKGPKDLYGMPPEEQEKIIAGAPGNLGEFLKLMLKMTEREHIFHVISEYEFSGHVGDKGFLFYYGTNCFGEVIPPLPEEQTYQITVIDAWNMTQEVLTDEYRPGQIIKLPGREYTALLARTKRTWE